VDNALVVAFITAFPAVPTRAVTGFVVFTPRAVTFVRELVVAGLFTTPVVRAVRETVPRATVARGDDAIAREEVLVREDAELFADDTARDADVERFIVLRCATLGC
jgi:hypothetical protein